MNEVWIVDDDRSIRWVLEKVLTKAGFTCRSFSDGNAAWTALQNDCPGVLISDIRMPGPNGIDLLTRIKEKYPKLPVIITTAFSDLESAVSAFQKGAFEYLPKPFDINKAVQLVQRAMADQEPSAAADEAEENEEEGHGTLELIGKAPVMQDVFRAIGRLSHSSMTVLITGESGAGKEVVARALHRSSPRSKAPFIALNMAAIPRELMESELFGHERGAFTGALATRSGRFEQADGGTLFLDEVGNLTMEMQQMLLRAIQERRYRPVGAKEDKTANVRIVAATNEDLQKAVTEKRFRQDLLYRLQEYVITMPPLRDCPEDIMPLAEFFREMANRELEREVKGFAASARNALLAHAWPGNVRELKQKIQTAVLQSEGDMITEADLELDNEPSATSACFTLKSGDEERGRILRALKQAAGNKKMAAKILGIGRTTLYNKLVEYGLNEEN